MSCKDGQVAKREVPNSGDGLEIHGRNKGAEEPALSPRKISDPIAETKLHGPVSRRDHARRFAINYTERLDMD